MNRLWMLMILLSTANLSPARAASDGSGPLAAVNRLFAAMASHDANAARGLFLPNAQIASIGSDGAAHATSSAAFVDHLEKSKDQWLERIWDVKVFEKDALAAVWAPYDFHLNGKFGHRGVDSFSLMKSAGEWKIAFISYSNETSTCKPSPLGPPSGKQ